jgi:thiol-disulfide isomerase/thioredoxin
MFRRCLALWAAVLFASVPAQVARAASAAAGGDAAGIAWEKDFKAALQQARGAGRPVLVDFWADWCAWCHKLDATTYRDPAVIELARAFVPVKVNTEGSRAEVELAAQYGVQTLPTIGFLSPAGRLFFRRTSYEAPGEFADTLQAARTLAKDVAAWEEALGRNGKDATALAGLGVLLAEQDLLPESAEMLRAARKADKARPVPERKRTRRFLARAEQARGKRSDAERLLQEALALQPADLDEDAAAREALAALPAR